MVQNQLYFLLGLCSASATDTIFSDMDAAMVLERIVILLHDFIGDMTEQSILSNVMLVTELVDEILVRMITRLT